MKHAVINKENKVVNIVIWEGASWQPPKDHIIVRSDVAQIGDIYAPQDNSFSKQQPE